MLARRLGPAFVLPNLEPLEQLDRHKYDRQPEAQAGGLPQQEHSHARLLQAITSGSRAGLEGSRIAQLEGRHRAIGGTALRAAVLGANNGLLSNFSLVMGVAGATGSGTSVLVDPPPLVSFAAAGTARDPYSAGTARCMRSGVQ